jgi:hypothetical protein
LGVTSSANVARPATIHSRGFRELAAELTGINVDLIVARGTPAILAARNATATIPIVMVAISDPLLAVASLARPGGNITGLTTLDNDLYPKRLELLKEIAPTVTRIADIAPRPRFSPIRTAPADCCAPAWPPSARPHPPARPRPCPPANGSRTLVRRRGQRGPRQRDRHAWLA